MSLRRLGLVRLGLLVVIVSAAPLASACSSDVSVDFTPVGGSSVGATTSGGSGTAGDTTSGGTANKAGSPATGGDSAMGGTGQGGSAHGGTGMTAGNAGASGDAGNNSGGNAMGGNAMGGMAMGGNAMGGNAMGGMAMGGNAMGGDAGMGGNAMAGGGNAMGGNAGTGGNAGGSGGTGGGGTCTPSAEICDGIDNNCDDQIDPKGTCPDTCTGALYGGHRYMFCGTVSNVSSSVALCTGASMSGVSIESAEENAFILGKIEGDTWLGGSDIATDGTWRWVPTNQTFWNKGNIDGIYQNWANGDPSQKIGNNEDCMVLVDSGANTGKWSDLSCDSGGKRAACEAVTP